MAIVSTLKKSALSIPQVNPDPQPPNADPNTAQTASLQTKVAGQNLQRQPAPVASPLTQTLNSTQPVDPNNLFKFSSYNAGAGQPDPRDATYWANLSKLMFNANQNYSQNLLDQTYSDTDYQTAQERQGINQGQETEDFGLTTKRLATQRQYVDEDFGKAGVDLSRQRRYAEEDYTRNVEGLGIQRKLNQRGLAEQAIRNNLSSSGYLNRSDREQGQAFGRDVEGEGITRTRKLESLQDQEATLGTTHTRNLDSIKSSLEDAGIGHSRALVGFMQRVEDLNTSKSRDDAARIAARNAILQGYSIDEAGLLAEAAANYAERKRQEAEDSIPDYSGDPGAAAAPAGTVTTKPIRRPKKQPERKPKKKGKK